MRNRTAILFLTVIFFALALSLVWLWRGFRAEPAPATVPQEQPAPGGTTQAEESAAFRQMVADYDARMASATPAEIEAREAGFREMLKQIERDRTAAAASTTNSD